MADSFGFESEKAWEKMTKETEMEKLYREYKLEADKLIEEMKKDIFNTNTEIFAPDSDKDITKFDQKLKYLHASYLVRLKRIVDREENE